MKVTIIPIVDGGIGIITKGLLKELVHLEFGGRVETIQLQHYWEWPEYWEESGRLEEICCHSVSGERILAKADVQNSQWVKIIFIEAENDTWNKKKNLTNQAIEKNDLM